MRLLLLSFWHPQRGIDSAPQTQCSGIRFETLLRPSLWEACKTEQIPVAGAPTLLEIHNSSRVKAISAVSGVNPIKDHPQSAKILIIPFTATAVSDTTIKKQNYLIEN